MERINKKRIFLYFVVLFTLFTTLLIVIQQRKEREYRTTLMKSILNNYTRVVHTHILREQLFNSEKINKLAVILPSEIRVTIISKEGKVLYNDENYVSNVEENYLDYPEIQQSIYWEEGVDVRKSYLNNKKFIYYSKYFPGYFIRVALPYNIYTVNKLDLDDMYIYMALLIFFVMLFLLNTIIDKSNKFIFKLERQMIELEKNREITAKMYLKKDYPDNE